MIEARIARVAGASALIGGSAWSVATILHALQPTGCVQEECLVRPEREASTATSWLVVLAAVAMVAFVVALVVLLAQSGELGWPGILGVAACGLGTGALALAAALPALRGMRPLPFMVAVAVGMALLGWAVLRSRVLPTWAGASLLGGVVLLAGFGEQTWRVLFALPFGLAWLATGLALVSGASRPTGRQSAASVPRGR